MTQIPLKVILITSKSHILEGVLQNLMRVQFMLQAHKSMDYLQRLTYSAVNSCVPTGMQ